MTRSLQLSKQILVELLLHCYQRPKKDFAPCDNICVLMSRVLCEHVEFFKKNFEDIVDTHIKHEFYDEMSMKSIMVSVIMSKQPVNLTMFLIPGGRWY